jgi:hypothetical protein
LREFKPNPKLKFHVAKKLQPDRKGLLREKKVSKLLGYRAVIVQLRCFQILPYERKDTEGGG